MPDSFGDCLLTIPFVVDGVANLKGRLHELFEPVCSKLLSFSAKTERFTTYGTELGAENRPFLAHVNAPLINIKLKTLCGSLLRSILESKLILNSIGKIMDNFYPKF